MQVKWGTFNILVEIRGALQKQRMAFWPSFRLLWMRRPCLLGQKEGQLGEKCQAESREARQPTHGLRAVARSCFFLRVHRLKPHLGGPDEGSCCKEQGGSPPSGSGEVRPGESLTSGVSWSGDDLCCCLGGEPAFAHQPLRRVHAAKSAVDSNCTSRFFSLWKIFLLDDHNPRIDCHSCCSNCPDLF